MKTTDEALPESRAEVEVEVPSADVDKATSRAARGLAKEMRLPGFRAGKAPPSLVIQRVGFGTVLQEAIREALPEWYELALFDSGVSPIGDPEIEMVSAPEEEGQPLEFKFTVGCGREPSWAPIWVLKSARKSKRSPTMSSRPRSSGSARASR